MSQTTRKQNWKITKIPNLYLLGESGTYYLRVKPKRGKRQRISLKTTDFTVARERMRQHMLKLETVKSDGNEKISSLIENYKIDLTRRELVKEITASNKLYKEECLEQVAGSKTVKGTWPEFKLLKISDLSEKIFENWIATHSQAYSATRTNGAVTVMRELLRIAVKDRLLARETMEDIAHGLKYVSVDYDYKRMTLSLPSREEVAKVRLEVYRRCKMKGTMGGYLFDLLLCSGMRIDTARHTKWEDVHKDKGTLFASKAKTGSYTIPLFPDLLELVERLEKAFPNHKPEDKLVPGVSIQTVLTSSCKAMGVRHMSNHDLRHIFATRCIEKGVDVSVFSRWMGHRDGGRTAQLIYGHLRMAHSQEEAAKMRFIEKPEVKPEVKVETVGPVSSDLALIEMEEKKLKSVENLPTGKEHENTRSTDGGGTERSSETQTGN